MTANTHSDAVTALEVALAALRTAANDYKALVNAASTALGVAVDAFNAAGDTAGAIARDMRAEDAYLELWGPSELEFEAPQEWPVNVELAMREVALFADLNAAVEDARDARRDYHEDMKHRADMSNPDRYL